MLTRTEVVSMAFYGFIFCLFHTMEYTISGLFLFPLKHRNIFELVRKYGPFLLESTYYQWWVDSNILKNNMKKKIDGGQKVSSLGGQHLKKNFLNIIHKQK